MNFVKLSTDSLMTCSRYDAMVQSPSVNLTPYQWHCINKFYFRNVFVICSDGGIVVGC